MAGGTFGHGRGHSRFVRLCSGLLLIHVTGGRSYLVCTYALPCAPAAIPPQLQAAPALLPTRPMVPEGLALALILVCAFPAIAGGVLGSDGFETGIEMALLMVLWGPFRSAISQKAGGAEPAAVAPKPVMGVTFTLQPNSDKDVTPLEGQSDTLWSTLLSRRVFSHGTAYELVDLSGGHSSTWKKARDILVTYLPCFGLVAGEWRQPGGEAAPNQALWSRCHTCVQVFCFDCAGASHS